MNQNLKPLASYAAPKYPTKEQVKAQPRLLALVPRRWRDKPRVLTALMLTLSTGLAGCASASGPATDISEAPPVSEAAPAPSDAPAAGSMEASVSSMEPEPEPNPKATQGPTPSTIPIFQHGTGRGSYGCESVAPPVFLSEEEALQVIQEEAAAQGISFTAQKTIEGEFPATSVVPGEAPSPDNYQGTLELDGYDEALNIGMEFVSQQDVADWVAPNEGVWASVEEFDMLDTAQRLSDATTGVAVFYDPASQDYDAFDPEQMEPNPGGEDTAGYVERYIAEQKEKSIEDLRAQVRDFLQWLAGQGVI